MAEDQPPASKLDQRHVVMGIATADRSTDSHFRTQFSSIDDLLKRANLEEALSLELDAQNLPAADRDDQALVNREIQKPQIGKMDLLRDVDLDVTIELGRTQMAFEDVLKLGEGSVVSLDRLAGDPVDVLVNDRVVAKGEVVVLNDNFAVRVTEVLAGTKEEAV